MRHDGAADGGLAGAGFAHQTEGLTFVNFKVGTVHGLEGLAAGAVGHLEVLDLKQDLPGEASPSCWRKTVFCSNTPPGCSLLRKRERHDFQASCIPSSFNSLTAAGGSTFGARGSSSQVPGLVGGADRKVGRALDKVDLQRLGVAGRKGITVDLGEADSGVYPEC